MMYELGQVTMQIYKIFQTNTKQTEILKSELLIYTINMHDSLTNQTASNSVILLYFCVTSICNTQKKDLCLLIALKVSK